MSQEGPGVPIGFTGKTKPMEELTYEDKSKMLRALTVWTEFKSLPLEGADIAELIAKSEDEPVQHVKTFIEMARTWEES